jgi:hypothetical protein
MIAEKGADMILKARSRERADLGRAFSAGVEFTRRIAGAPPGSALGGTHGAAGARHRNL